MAWVGDYANEQDDFKFDLPATVVRPSYKKVWGNRVKSIACQTSDFTLDDKFLINYDSRQYIDLNEYKSNCVDNSGWIIHPLPLLTAIGNNRGCGDFHKDGIGYEFVGKWTWQLLAFLDSVPNDFEKADIRFIEIR